MMSDDLDRLVERLTDARRFSWSVVEMQELCLNAAATITRLREALVQGEAWFLDYERQHRAKGTPDADAKDDDQNP